MLTQHLPPVHPAGRLSQQRRPGRQAPPWQSRLSRRFPAAIGWGISTPQPAARRPDMAQTRFTCTLTRADEPACQSCTRVTIVDSEGASARACPRRARRHHRRSRGLGRLQRPRRGERGGP